MLQENKKGQLSGKAALSLIVGSIIGAGLFMKPASMAAQLGSPMAMTITWLVAGFFTLCGALVIAELVYECLQQEVCLFTLQVVMGPRRDFYMAGLPSLISIRHQWLQWPLFVLLI
jgi:amino acid permease